MGTGDRVARIGDAAIEVLAEEGMRGLTHRAVDRAAELPPGSTSYYARTRAALLELAVTRMVELDETAVLPAAPHGPDEAAAYVARFVHALVSSGPRMIARYEFALEATRRPEVREIYQRAALEFRRRCAEVLAAVGSPDPGRHTRMVIAWCEGLIFDTVAGAGSGEPPSFDELLADTRELLRGMLG
ncbi:TetR/AcrR family transcriptional regulator [Amycolatopsis minnesotensis]|uniref:TetR/AcrR family transcriptional regulator n=1 Tax=Amycolatopsis minnesotensis TaxID=337894 RepID=UPI0031DBEBC1